MNENDWLEIMNLLSNDEYLTESFIPIDCFFIAHILKQLNNCLEDVNAFNLAKLDSLILYFCYKNKQKNDLMPYIVKLEKITLLTFSIEDVIACKCIFDEMYVNYDEKYSNRITATPVIL